MRYQPRHPPAGGISIVVLVLLLLHYYVRPRFWDGPLAPDFLLVALLMLAIRSRPGVAAVLGLLVGLAYDVLVPAHFGVGMLAHTLVGYLASQGRAVVFAENRMVTAMVLAIGLLVRNLTLVILSGSIQAGALGGILVNSTIQAMTTAVAGSIVLLIFKNRFALRLDS